MKPRVPDSAMISRATPRRPVGVDVREVSAPPGWALRLASGEPAHERASIGDNGCLGGLAADVSVRVGPEAALVTVTLPSVHNGSESALAGASERMFRVALERLAQTPFPHPVRMWNFLAGICAPVGDDLDRYRVFNAARRRAFARCFGDDAIESGRLPTASCVGPGGTAVTICALGAAEPGRPLENPRQIPAFRYSPKHGPEPPCFSRATLARFGAQRMLLVAGTASVLGEDSAHHGSLRQQLDETMNNLRSIVRQGREAAGEPAVGEPLRGLRAVRVYAKHAGDIAWLERNLPNELRACAPRDTEFLRADICREELLVEIEIVVDVAGA